MSERCSQADVTKRRCPPRGRLKVSRLSGPGLEIIVRYARQLLDESHDGPDFPVGHLDGPEARHTRHVDAVLDDPEQLWGRDLVGKILEIGRIGAQAFGELGPIDARRAVTIGAAALREGALARLHGRRIVERYGGRSFACRSIEAWRTLTRAHLTKAGSSAEAETL